MTTITLPETARLPPFARSKTAPPAWPLYAVVVSYPLWWALGVGYFIWPVLTLPLLLGLLARKEIKLPPGFGLWMLFLGWVMLSGFQLTGGIISFSWRVSIYISATILLVYVFNASRQKLSDRAIVMVLLVFWVEVIIAGLAGVIFPTVSFHTPVERFIPASMLGDGLVRNMVHPGLADIMTLIGYPVGRPKALFAYTNQWGACAAVLTPFALAALIHVRRRGLRFALIAMLLISVIPIIVSLNRGVWISLGLALAYMAARFLRLSNPRAIMACAGGLIAIVLLIYATPLNSLAQDRVNKQSQSTATRESLYSETQQDVMKKPLFGYGSPSLKTKVGTTPPVGTQGQIWLLAYSHGIPGLLFFLAWMAYTVVRSVRTRSRTHFWAHLAIVVALFELPFYSLIPVALMVVMIAAGLVWRNIARPEITMSG